MLPAQAMASRACASPAAGHRAGGKLAIALGQSPRAVEEPASRRVGAGRARHSAHHVGQATSRGHVASDGPYRADLVEPRPPLGPADRPRLFRQHRPNRVDLFVRHDLPRATACCRGPPAHIFPEGEACSNSAAVARGRLGDDNAATSARSNAMPATALRSDTREQSKLAALLGLNRDYIASVQISRCSPLRRDPRRRFPVQPSARVVADRAMFLEQTARPVAIRDPAAEDVNISLMGDVAIMHAATAPRPAAATPTCGRAAAGAGSASRRT